MALKNYANTRFSGLDQIDTGNIANLQVAWTFSLDANRGHKAAPLVAAAGPPPATSPQPGEP